MPAGASLSYRWNHQGVPQEDQHEDKGTDCAGRAAQLRAQEKPLMLALNVPTYITLYGYGYRNVYELAELVNVAAPRISFEGTAAR